jgi:hypothetical protein
MRLPHGVVSRSSGAHRFTEHVSSGRAGHPITPQGGLLAAFPLAIVLLLLIGLLPTIVPVASATPVWGPAEVDRFIRNQELQPPSPPQVPSPTSYPYVSERPAATYLLQYMRTAAFLSAYQVAIAGADFGGIREGEHLQTIIQTDNTSEAIWVWTRYFELTGDNQYYTNIQNAFTYSLLHPAYNEEGGYLATTGYYRMYNCGWAVRAEQKYRDVYGDTTYKTYSDSCASYIAHHTLTRYGNPFYDYVNPPVLSWALGNLYDAGIHESNQGWKDYATQQAETKVKAWVEAEPALMGNQTWAMSGGATMWGFIRSYLQAHPESTATWIPRYKGYMDTYSDAGDFTNAWNGWYACGHRAVGLALADPYHLGIHMALTDTLITEDGDLDGGVPAKPPDLDTQDQTWVSNYLAWMGLSDVLGPASAVTPIGASRSSVTRVTAAPNPFTESVRLLVDKVQPYDLSATIHDSSGRRVATVTGGASNAGAVPLLWDGRLENGERAPAGVYLASISASGEKAYCRIVLLR